MYFGRWPSYLPLFLDSCRRNKEVDFLFLSDCGDAGTIESHSNCRYVHCSLLDVAARIRSSVGVQTEVVSPYKMCDLKPMYGELFHEHLTDYDFWGLCDIDLVFGCLRKFLFELDQYDFFSVREPWPSASFMLFRNMPMMNGLYQRAPDLHEIIQSPQYEGFDECCGAFQPLLAGVPASEIQTKYRSLAQIVHEAHATGEIRAHRHDIAYEKVPKGVLTVDNGRITDELGHEYVDFHYIRAKLNPWFIYPDWEDVPDRYFISRFGFHQSHPGWSGMRVLFSASALGHMYRHDKAKYKAPLRKIARGDLGVITRSLGRWYRGTSQPT